MGTIALVVEELSPGHRVGEVTRRAHRFLKAGVPVVWLVDTEERVVLVYRAGTMSELVGETEELALDDITPGFRCRPAEFFTPSSPTQEDAG
jgi:Uma2 family endonuclease